MKDFKELDKRVSSEVNEDILKSWGSVTKICDETIKNREGNPKFVFYDGPATANGNPGLHHMLAKFLKDTVCKYKTMKGYQVYRKIGWDTHGLPVELQVEKELGFHNKSDIEKYGIEAFNKKCRESVWKNEDSFSDLTSKMGQFIDLEHPYVTYDNNYIETEWWILKKFFDEGYFYEGSKILPYCPRCGTGLASHEVAQGYQEDTVDTVIVPMKSKSLDAYFLVWTTTPWTLIANVALCVNPKENYILVESKGVRFILAEKLAHNILGDEFTVLKTYTGKELEYQEYEQLLPFLEVKGKAFYVCCDPYVTMEDGTGIVHLAPAFGEDDAKVGKKYKLPYLNPVGDDGKYTDGPWKGTLVFDANDIVIKYLKENDKLFKKQRMVHNYPHCWRCHTSLIYYSKPSFYIETTKFKDQIVASNREVNWYPAYVGEKRFGNWLLELKDWAISRNRYWGTPLPLWRCECGYDHMVGSREELAKMSTTKIDVKTIDLHRPYMDDIKLKCPKCGKEMTRVKDVIDCWFDSGSMPFAQYHYPFENKAMFESQFPADFICEGIDQTRGWFYTLLVISTFVKGCSPYKNVLVNDLLLDAEGKKMSKTMGNIVEPFSTMNKYGADTVRFYLAYVSPVWTPLKFSEEGLKEVYSKFLNPLRNSYSFFELYANTDHIDTDKCLIPYENREEIDLWLLSKYNHLVKNVTSAFEEYDLNKATRYIASFVSEDLSNWYIRRNRNRFWKSELDASKKSVYITTYEVLEGLSRLIAPITPFISEELYRDLTGKESVHLADYPVCDETLLNDALEEKMDLVRDLIALGRNAREEVKIKVREPLLCIYLDGKKKKIIGNLVPLIEEELNVKKVEFIKDLSEYMNFNVKPNFKEVGKVFGPKIKDFQVCLTKLTNKEITSLENNKKISILMNDEKINVTKDMVDIRVEAKDGYDVAMENNNFIILNTERTPELINEGIAREFVSKIQQLRKAKDYNVVDRIHIYYEGSEHFKEALNSFEQYVKDETLAVTIDEKKLDMDAQDINGEQVKYDITKKEN